jgi:hypothetical protein
MKWLDCLLTDKQEEYSTSHTKNIYKQLEIIIVIKKYHTEDINMET